MKKAFLQLHIAVFLAGFTGILGELISLNEGMIVWYRMLITAVSLWIFFGVRQKLRAISVRDKLRISGIGFITALHWICFYGSIKYANVSVALVCFSGTGFFSAILEPLLTREKINKLELLLGSFAILGIYVIFHFDAQFKTGIILGVLSAFFAALFPIFIRQTIQRINVETVLTWQISGGFLALSLFMPVYLYYFPADPFIPTMTDWVWLLVLAWLCTVVALQFSTNALKRLSAFTVSLSYNLEPLYGLVLAFLFFKENKFLSGWFYIGMAIIGLSLIGHAVLLNLEHRRKQQQKPA